MKSNQIKSYFLRPWCFTPFSPSLSVNNKLLHLVHSFWYKTSVIFTCGKCMGGICLEQLSIMIGLSWLRLSSNPFRVIRVTILEAYPHAPVIPVLFTMCLSPFTKAKVCMFSDKDMHWFTSMIVCSKL